MLDTSYIVRKIGTVATKQPNEANKMANKEVYYKLMFFCNTYYAWKIARLCELGSEKLWLNIWQKDEPNKKFKLVKAKK